MPEGGSSGPSWRRDLSPPLATQVRVDERRCHLTIGNPPGKALANPPFRGLTTEHHRSCADCNPGDALTVRDLGDDVQGHTC
jgi:hypothetical protein